MIYLLKTSVFTHPSHVRSPRMVFSLELGYDIWCEKSRVLGLLGDENCMILRLLALTQ